MSKPWLQGASQSSVSSLLFPHCTTVRALDNRASHLSSSRTTLPPGRQPIEFLVSLVPTLHCRMSASQSSVLCLLFPHYTAIRAPANRVSRISSFHTALPSERQPIERLVSQVPTLLLPVIGHHAWLLRGRNCWPPDPERRSAPRARQQPDCEWAALCVGMCVERWEWLQTHTHTGQADCEWAASCVLNDGSDYEHTHTGLPTSSVWSIEGYIASKLTDCNNNMSLSDRQTGNTSAMSRWQSM